MQRRAGLAAGQAASAVPFSCPRAERNRRFVGRWRRHIQRRRLLPSPMNQYTPTGSEFPRARSASLTRRLAGPSPGPRSRGGAETRHARLVCIECGAVAGEEAEGRRAYLGWRHPSAERRRRWISSSVQSCRPVVPRGAPVADAVCLGSTTRSADCAGSPGSGSRSRGSCSAAARPCRTASGSPMATAASASSFGHGIC
jgi:hypothetical protein